MPKGGLMIALGLEKPKPSFPPSLSNSRSPSAAAPPKPSAPAPAPTEPDPLASDDGGKTSPEEAGVVLANEKCGDCVNWHYDTGDCDEVDGNYKALDGCRNHFEAKGGGLDAGLEPDADDAGMAGAAKTPAPMMGAQ